MADRVGPDPSDEGLDRVRVAKVGDGELGTGIHVLAPPRAEVVEDDDLVAPRDQGVDDMASDEAGSSGHDDAHVSTLVPPPRRSTPEPVEPLARRRNIAGDSNSGVVVLQ